MRGASFVLPPFLVLDCKLLSNWFLKHSISRCLSWQCCLRLSWRKLQNMI